MNCILETLLSWFPLPFALPIIRLILAHKSLHLLVGTIKNISVHCDHPTSNMKLAKLSIDNRDQLLVPTKFTVTTKASEKDSTAGKRMAFVKILVTCSDSTKRAHVNDDNSTKRPRRVFLRLASAVSISLLLQQRPSSASETLKGTKEWKREELCDDCGGRGKQSCSLCEGTGVYSVDDSVVQQDHVCPNCQGVGTIRCLACIGLGLADTKGILRNGTLES